jgi:hypothetical protein
MWPHTVRLTDPGRLQSLRRLELLDTPPEPAFDRFTRLAARLLRAPIAVLMLVEHDRQFLKSQVGMGEPWATLRQMPLSYSFCQYAVTTGTPLAIEDACVHPLVADSLAVLENGVVAYLGIPLRLADGHSIGTLCVIDHVPRFWSEEEIETLGELAALVVTEVTLREQLRQITAQQQAAAEQAQLLAQEHAARADMEAAVQARDAFLSIAAHEIKSPLTALLGRIQLLQRHLAPAGANDAVLLRDVAAVREQAWRLNTLVDTLLDMSRIEAGQLALARQPVDLRVLARQVAAEFAPGLTRHQLTVDMPDTPLLVVGDQVRLAQVLSNLLSNAVKYSPQSGPIELRLTREEAVALLTVRDAGIGIPPEALPHLFQKFYRVPSLQAQGISGNGIGLYVVREIITLHGGTVAVASVPGEGSTFSVSLPLLA